MKLIFVRHGDPSPFSFSITKKGKEEIERLGEYWKEKNISALYSATSVRAKETAEILSLKKQMEIKYISCLNEFKYKLDLGDGKDHYPWELPLNLWCDEESSFDYKKSLENPIYDRGDIKREALKIQNELDEILNELGYKREEHYYKVERGNRESIVFVSHFATISVLLSHLLNIPLIVMLHFFWISPSGVVTVVSEEMEKGKAIFRCIAYNDCGHLVGHEELLSCYGRQSEIVE